MSYSNIGARYAHIKPVLERFQRPFTVLDLGAFECAFGAKICEDFTLATVISVDQNLESSNEDPEGRLLVPYSMIHLRRRLTVEDMQQLSQCEHFDVTLCLNFLHHQAAEWGGFLASIFACSRYVFVQTPEAHDFQAAGQGTVQEIARFYAHHEPIGKTVQFSGHMERPLYLHECKRIATLTRASVTSPEKTLMARVAHSDADKTIELRHKSEAPKPWTYGFNLENFLALGGVWPCKSTLIRMLREMPLPEKIHGDINTHNIIIDGRRAQLIDGGEEWATWDDRLNVERVIAQVEERMQ